MKVVCVFICTLIILLGCTKKVGKNPLLAYSDYGLLDSINASNTHYYQNNNNLLQAAGNSPHGAFKLRFNSIGYNALTINGKLPNGMKMPDGSLIVKDIYDGNNNISFYAFMYKKSGSWIWGEIKPNRTVLYSVDKNPAVCVNCHSQAGNIDLVTSFYLH